MFVQLKQSAFYHLSLKKMSHDDSENLLESAESSLSYTWIQRLFGLVLEESNWILLSARAQTGYQLWPGSGIRTSDLTQTDGKTGYWSLVCCDILSCLTSNNQTQLKTLNISNTYTEKSQQIFLLSVLITFIWFSYLLSESTTFVLVEISPTVLKLDTATWVQISQLLFLSKEGNKPTLAPCVLSWPECWVGWVVLTLCWKVALIRPGVVTSRSGCRQSQGWVWSGGKAGYQRQAK